MDEVITKEEGRIVKVQTNYIDQLIHIQEQLDEEIMVTTLKFEECLSIASKILDVMSKSHLRAI